jgi:hypothetical protein
MHSVEADVLHVFDIPRKIYIHQHCDHDAKPPKLAYFGSKVDKVLGSDFYG